MQDAIHNTQYAYLESVAVISVRLMNMQYARCNTQYTVCVHGTCGGNFNESDEYAVHEM